MSSVVCLRTPALALPVRAVRGARASRAAAVTPAAVARPAGVKTSSNEPSDRALQASAAPATATSALAALTFFAMPEAAQAAVDPNRDYDTILDAQMWRNLQTVCGERDAPSSSNVAPAKKPWANPE